MVRKIIGIILCALVFSPVAAQPGNAQEYFQQANTQYQNNQYEDAEQSYLQSLDLEPENARVHFNLGNTYFKLNQIGRAVLHYEKALKYHADYEKAQYNIQIAQARVIDEVEASPTAAFYNQWERFLTTFGASTFAIVALSLLLLAVVGLYLFITGSVAKIRKSGFALMLVFMVLFAVTTYLSYAANDVRISSDEAVILTLKVDVKTEPKGDAATAFVLHEGAKVGISSEVDSWVEIKLENGNMGWVNTQDLGRI